MPISPVIDLALGMVFVYLLVSLICSQVGDNISTWLTWRAQFLEDGIRDLIMKGDSDLVQKLYSHPLVQSLVPEDLAVTKFLRSTPVARFVHKGGPLNIHGRTFALALFDSVIPKASSASKIEQLLAIITALPPNNPVRAPLLSIVTPAEVTIEAARKNVEEWFDHTVDRTTVLYRQHMLRVSLVIALGVTVILNVDTLAIGLNLWHDSPLRQATAAAASKYAEANDLNNPVVVQQLNSLKLPIGWKITFQPFSAVPGDWINQPIGIKDVLYKLLGWAITAVAGAQGAPFWFDLLKKLTQRG